MFNVIFAFILLISEVSYAADPIQETFESELRALRENPKAPDAETHLIWIFSLWNDVGPGPVTAVLKQYAEDKNTTDRVRSRARFLSAVATARLGNPEEAKAQIAEMGFIGSWAHIGPFSNEGGVGFETEYPPEKGGAQDPDAPMEGKEKAVYWRPLPLSAFHLGLVHLEALHIPYDNSCRYAKTVLQTEREGSGLLQVGAGGAFQAFWNGKKALSDDKYRAAGPDRRAAVVALKKGDNTLLIKVCTEEVGDFGFYARVTDNQGNAYPLKPISDPMSGVPIGASSKKNPRALMQPEEVLIARATKKPDDPAAQAAAARYLYFTDARDLNTNEARDMAKTACEIGKNEEDCLLWSLWALDRNEQRLALDRAKSARPTSANVLSALAEWEIDGPDPAQALPYIEQVLAARPDSVRAAMLKIEVMSRRGFVRTAFAEAEKLATAHPMLPAVVDFAQYTADISGSISKSSSLKERGAALNFDEVDRHTVLADTALARHDLKALDRHIEGMLSAAPYSDDTYMTIAHLQEGAGRIKQAEYALRQRLLLAPENASALVDLGLFLMRENRRDEGIEALSTASRIRPQDAWLAEYLQHLGPDEPLESSFIIPDTVFLASKNADVETDESRYLVDQTAVEVYDSGLSSRFRQIVFEIGNRSDAKDWRTRDIQYLPDSQQLKILAAKVYRKDGSVDKVINRDTVSVSEPWYRLYYDVVAEVLEFPSLNPGDVVEISYRLDDVSTRNIFNDYFGDFLFIDEMTPKAFWRYVVIAPKERELRFNQPAYPVESATNDEDGKISHSFQARDIPALRSEADMPGMSEVAAYLHVSTYKSWEDLGRWYQGLIRHQMIPDLRIRAKVKELIRGKKTETEKVRAVYDWVVTATRYVGLEFGIHGYKPYRASLVVSRGFGDCKDKASLLVTMLREANIKAEFVLIRTSDLGLLSAEPASLSVFNHAIAYVPDLHLYLDGTAENHGIFELPFGDQGAFALILKDTGATLVTTPVEPSLRNFSKITSKMVLDKEGNAALTSSAFIRGSDAAALRRGLEAEATRKDRFEASLASVYPGAHVEKLDILSLSDLADPVAYEFSARIPIYAVQWEDGIEVPMDEGLGLTAAYARLPEREYDLVIGPPRVMERNLEIRPPDGYNLADMPKPTKIVSQFGFMRLQVQKKGNAIDVNRRFELFADRVTPEEYAEFVDFIRKIDETLSRRLVFRRQK